ncbi:hypothetical protein ACLIBH_12275 [Virgibacillus sp. W0430]|uniref:hypothetical protein n=1 Tax=Virgibacillus sp. W0430 TaxID=3391580 RepID=UPI003F4639E9
MIKAHISWYDLESNSIKYDDAHIEEPRQCMHCRNTGTQISLGLFGTPGRNDNHQGTALFSCQLCGSTSIHFLTIWRKGDLSFFDSAEAIPPLELGHLDFSKTIQDKFSSFCKIYNQAKRAEEEKLDQIAGMGYRKALEFLVTDYLLQYPVDGVSDDWLKSPNVTLGNKISKITSNRIQKLARAISFIGNDETHYSRRHPEHDTNSIKAFIRVLVAEIENEIEFEKAEALISKPRS